MGFINVYKPLAGVESLLFTCIMFVLHPLAVIPNEHGLGSKGQVSQPTDLGLVAKDPRFSILVESRNFWTSYSYAQNWMEEAGIRDWKKLS